LLPSTSVGHTHVPPCPETSNVCSGTSPTPVWSATCIFRHASGFFYSQYCLFPGLWVSLLPYFSLAKFSFS
jgi:hypothetical protein